MIKVTGKGLRVFLLLLYAVAAVPGLAASPMPENSVSELPSSTNRLREPFAVYREAGASEEQQAQIQALAGEFEKMARVKAALLRNLAKQLQEASFEPELDEKKILALQEEMNQLQVTLNSERIKLMLKIRQLLNQEQKIKLVQIMKERTGQPTMAPAAAETP